MRRNISSSPNGVFLLILTACALVVYVLRQMHRTPSLERLSPVGRYNLDELFGSGDSGENVFFIETDETKVEFGAKYLCAFEAAAERNPDKKVG